jgi:L-ribulokinase
MAIVAGVDFGTLSVRVTIVDTAKGRLGSALAEYPLHRKKDDPDHATQSHADHMRALAEATRKAISAASISGEQVAALASDTTG